MVKLYVIPECQYCDKLKGLLENDGISYEVLDITNEENHEMYEKLSKIGKTDSVPLIIVGKHILSPDVSFKTINQAFEIIKKLI
jgi:glutaredoxin